MNYKTYAWIGLAGVVLSVISNLIGEGTTSSIFSILSYTTYSVFLWAFVDIADRLKNTPLLIGSAALLILDLLVVLLNIFSLFATLPVDTALLQNPSTLMAFGVGLLVAMAVIFIVLGAFIITAGIGFLKLKDKFGGLATATGVLNIITGVSFVTVFLFFIGAFALIAAFILEIILLFKADKALE